MNLKLSKVNSIIDEREKSDLKSHLIINPAKEFLEKYKMHHDKKENPQDIRHFNH